MGRSMALDAVNPTTGPALGGTLVTVEGEGYAGSANAACAFAAVVDADERHQAVGDRHAIFEIVDQSRYPYVNPWQ